MRKTLLTAAALTAISVFTLGSLAKAEGRPHGCPHAWCGCFAAKYFGFTGAKARQLWLAKNWLRLPHVGPRVGAVAVLRRRGGGHVGIVQRFDANGNPALLSGNHNRRVAVSVYPRSRVIAYVQP